MNPRFPSIKSLQAFETAARLGNIRAAADYLCVTPSAVSKRIQALEEELGQVLFIREAYGLTLTPSGTAYAASLQSIFKLLSDATNSARIAEAQTLNVLVPPIYGYELIKALKDFEVIQQNVSLKFSIYSGAWGTDPRIADADVVIAFGDGNWHGWESRLLTPNGFSVPMCAPGYVPGDLEDPRDLAAYPWIQVQHFGYLWDHWCEAAGCPGLKPIKTIEFDSGLMAKQAAANSLGIWMGGGAPHMLPQKYFGNELVFAHPFHAFRHRHGFYLAYKPAADNPAASMFCEWLLAMGSMEPPSFSQAA